MSTVATLVDAFVEKVNTEPREAESSDEVPDFLREKPAGESEWDPSSSWTTWRIARRDNSARVEELEQRTGHPFPPSFQYFLANYSFPAFESGPVLFFANTGEDTFWELEKKLFKDPHMSPALLRAGLLQIGDPFFYNYDPACFECKGPRVEKRIVQVDHEEILCNDRIRVVKKSRRRFPIFCAPCLRTGRLLAVRRACPIRNRNRLAPQDRVQSKCRRRLLRYSSQARGRLDRQDEGSAKN